MSGKMSNEIWIRRRLAEGDPSAADYSGPALWADERDPNSFLLDSGQKVIWRCECAASFVRAIHKVTRSNQCYCIPCGIKYGKIKRRQTRSDRFHSASQSPSFHLWSPKNTLNPEEISAWSHKRSLWVCPLHGQWEAVTKSVAALGHGCPDCRPGMYILGRGGEWESQPMDFYLASCNDYLVFGVSVNAQRRMWDKHYKHLKLIAVASGEGRDAVMAEVSLKSSGLCLPPSKDRPAGCRTEAIGKEHVHDWRHTALAHGLILR